MMTTPESEIEIPQVAECALPEPPPIPSVPPSGPKREGTLRAYAERIVERLGMASALLLAAEIDEAVADEAEAAKGARP